MKEEVRQIAIKNFPVELHKKAKEAAAKEYISFKAFVIRALKNELKRAK